MPPARSSRKPRRLLPVLAGDLLLVGPDESTPAHDRLAADEQGVDPMRRREDEARDRIVRAAQLEPVGSPDREIRALSRLEGAKPMMRSVQLLRPEGRDPTPSERAFMATLGDCCSVTIAGCTK